MTKGQEMKKDLVYEGKAKKIWSTENDGLYISEFKDDLTAFNGEKKSSEAGKGALNNKISTELFNYLNKKGIPSHFVEMLDDNHMLHKRAEVILIEVILAELEKKKAEEYGFSLIDIAKGKLDKSYYEPGNTLADLANIVINAEEPLSSLMLTAKLEALVELNIARIITRPHLLTRSGETAEIEISQDFYVPVARPDWSYPYYIDIDSVSTGVKLNITPSLTEEGEIIVRFDADESIYIPSPKNIALTTDRNSVSSTVRVKNGQTIIIGGLLQNVRSRSTAGVPFFMKIPIINFFFRSFARSEKDREIVFYITPHVYPVKYVSREKR